MVVGTNRGAISQQIRLDWGGVAVTEEAGPPICHGMVMQKRGLEWPHPHMANWGWGPWAAWGNAGSAILHSPHCPGYYPAMAGVSLLGFRKERAAQCTNPGLLGLFCPLSKSGNYCLLSLSCTDILRDKQLCIWMGKVNLESFQLDLLI